MQASIIAFEPADQRTRELVDRMIEFSLGNTEADIEEEEEEEEEDGVLPEWLAEIANRAPQPAEANEIQIFDDVISP